MKILFSVKKQIIKRLDTERVVSSSKDYIIAKFEFTNDWINTIKTATFQLEDGMCYNVVLDTNNECNVPYDVTKKKGKFKVSVFGEDTRLITSNYVEVEVEESGCGEGTIPTPPTTSVYEQLTALLSHFNGGTTNKVLAKNSNENFDFKWADGGSGSSVWGQISGTLQNQTDLNNALLNKENVVNKVTTISAQSTDNEYPTAKCVYDLIGNVEQLLSEV